MRHPARRRREAGREVDRGGDGREDDVHGGHSPATGQPGPDLQPDEVGGGVVEPGGEARGRSERLGEQHSTHREALLDLHVQVGEALLALGGDPVPHPGDLAGQQDGWWQHDEGDEREAPAQRDHGHGGADDHGDVGGDRGGGLRHDALHAADVVDEPGLHLAAAGAGEEAERLALQVGEEVAAQPVHDLLADGGRQPGLDDADDGGGDSDAEHRTDQHQEEPYVLARERLVDDVAHEERLGQADGRAQHDEGDDDGQRRPVRREEPRDAAQRHGGVRQLTQVGRVGTGAARAAAAGGVEVVSHATSSSLVRKSISEVTSL